MNDIRSSILGQIAQEGWAGLRVDPAQVDAQMNAMLEEARREAALVDRVLSTADGQCLLLWLLTKTIFKPPTEEETQCQVGDRMVYLKGRRDGQNGVAFMLLHALQVAAGEKPRQETT